MTPRRMPRRNAPIAGSERLQRLLEDCAVVLVGHANEAGQTSVAFVCFAQRAHHVCRRGSTTASQRSRRGPHVTEHLADGQCLVEQVPPGPWPRSCRPRPRRRRRWAPPSCCVRCVRPLSASARPRCAAPVPGPGAPCAGERQTARVPWSRTQERSWRVSQWCRPPLPDVAQAEGDGAAYVRILSHLPARPPAAQPSVSSVRRPHVDTSAVAARTIASMIGAGCPPSPETDLRRSAGNASMDEGKR